MASGKASQEERHRQAADLEDRIALDEQTLALHFLEQEYQLRKEDKGQQKDLFEWLLSLMSTGVQLLNHSLSPLHGTIHCIPGTH